MNNILFICFLTFLLTIPQLSGQHENAISNQVLVRMQKNQDPYFMIRSVPTHFELKVESILSQHADIWLLEFNIKNTDLDEVLATLQRESTILYVQPNRKIELRAAPNDPLFGSQWHHDNIQSQLAWDITTGGTTANGKEIVVALIESADLINHNDLKGNQWVNTGEIPNNGIDDDGNGYIDDYNGWNVSTNNDAIGTVAHGTSCAGMIGAKGDNGTGVTGVNWDVKIMDIAGYNNPFTEANILASYNYALNARLIYNQTNGAQGAFVVVTSSSWGVHGGNPVNFPIWCSFYDDLGQAGILNIGATTNLNQNVDTYGDVPTTCASEYMIGVTATNYLDEIDFAGYGRQSVDLAAPGSSIYTTGPNNTYISTSGTSFACPLTAGIIGLMYSIPCSNLEELALIDPAGTASIVKQALFDGVDQTPHLQARTITGGRVNAKNALDNIMNATCTFCMPPSNVTTEQINDYDADISFNEIDSINDYNINIQVAGSGNWSNYTISDTNYTFTGLTSCTSYEYFISSICDGVISIPSQTQTFKTTGCGNCINLNYCETGTTTNSTASLTVHSPSSISGEYTYQITTNWGRNVENGYVFGELVLVDDGSTAPNEGCNTLVNATALNGNIAVVERGDCNFTIKALNAQNAGATALIVINNVAGTIDMAGSNTNITIPAIMISQSDGNILMTSIINGDQPQALLGNQNEWIETFQIAGNTFTSGDNNGYNFNEQTIVLNAGQIYPFTLTPGFDGQTLEEYSRIWIDFDQDGVFSNSELIYDQGTASSGILNGDFTIPVNALLGKTRMRLQLSYQGFGSGALPNVCGDFSNGEVEDYCIEIKSGIPCNMTVSATVVEPTCSELQNGSIELNIAGGTPGYTYAWNNGMNTASLSNLNANHYSAIITDATGCDTTVRFSLAYAKQLSLNESTIPPTCPNGDDGSISVNAAGSSGFGYQWNNGPDTNTWTNIEAGNYQITATDNDGCKITAAYSISDPVTIKPIANFTTDHYYLMIEFNNNSQNANSYEWDFDDGNTSTEFEPSHTYINDGNYNVCLTAIGTCDTLVKCKFLTVNKDYTDLEYEEIQMGINIYPNPASSFITIEKEIQNISKAYVYTAAGNQLYKIELNASSTKVSIENWTSGIYYLHFFNKNEELLVTKKLSIIQ